MPVSEDGLYSDIPRRVVNIRTVGGYKRHEYRDKTKNFVLNSGP